MSIKAKNFAAVAGVAALLAALAPASAAAQSVKPVPVQNGKPVPAAASTTNMSGSFDNFGLNGDDPIQLESDSADVFDQKNMAVFTGNVVARQNNSALRCKVLNVYYFAPGEAPPAPDSTTRDPQSGRKIKRLVADQNVLVTSDDQTASGSHADFDVVAHIIVMTGNVVLTQGKDVVRGDKLTVNLVANTAKMESNHRIQMLIDPKQPDTPPAPVKK